MHSRIVCGCFHTTTERSSCNRDCVAGKANSIYYLVLYRKILLTSGIGQWFSNFSLLKNHLKSLLKHSWRDPTHGDPGSVGLCQGLRTCLSNKFLPLAFGSAMWLTLANNVCPVVPSRRGSVFHSLSCPSTIVMRKTCLGWPGSGSQPRSSEPADLQMHHDLLLPFSLTLFGAGCYIVTAVVADLLHGSSWLIQQCEETGAVSKG